MKNLKRLLAIALSFSVTFASMPVYADDTVSPNERPAVEISEQVSEKVDVIEDEPVKGDTVEGAPVEESPIEETPIAESPVIQDPINQGPAEQNTDEHAPTGQIPAEQTSITQNNVFLPPSAGVEKALESSAVVSENLVQETVSSVEVPSETIEQVSIDTPVSGNEIVSDNSPISVNIVSEDKVSEVLEVSLNEISAQTDGYTITAEGAFPEDAELKIKRITNSVRGDQTVSDQLPDTVSFTVYEAFDIEIVHDDKVWQPIEYGESVDITVDGVSSDVIEGDITVYRISDDLKDIDCMPSEVIDDKIRFTTEHFTVFEIGGTTYTVGDAWYTDWTYDKDDENQIITLKKYNLQDTATELIIPATATIGGVVYKVAISPVSESMPINSPFNRYDTLESVVFESGVIFPASCYCLFGECTNLKKLVNISNVDTSNVTDMSHMFTKCSSLESLDLSNWDVSNVTNMSFMFFECILNNTSLDLSSWDTKNVTDMSYIFSGMSEEDLDNYTVKGIRSLDLSGWDFTNVTTTNSMFLNTYTIEELDISGLFTSRIPVDMTYMFAQTSTTYLAGKTDGKNDYNVVGLKTLNGTIELGSIAFYADYMFSGAYCLENLNLRFRDLNEMSNIYSAQGMYNNTYHVYTDHDYLGRTVEHQTYLHFPSDTWGFLGDMGTSYIRDCSYMFNKAAYIPEICYKGLLYYGGSSAGVDLNHMFANVIGRCEIDLTSWVPHNGPISWGISNVNNLSGMFEGAKYEAPQNDMDRISVGSTGITSVDISNWDLTGKDITDMFKDCDSIYKIKTPANYGGQTLTLPEYYINEDNLSRLPATFYYVSSDNIHIDEGHTALDDESNIVSKWVYSDYPTILYIKNTTPLWEEKIYPHADASSLHTQINGYDVKWYTDRSYSSVANLTDVIGIGKDKIYTPYSKYTVAMPAQLTLSSNGDKMQGSFIVHVDTSELISGDSVKVSIGDDSYFANENSAIHRPGSPVDNQVHGKFSMTGSIGGDTLSGDIVQAKRYWMAPQDDIKDDAHKKYLAADAGVIAYISKPEEKDTYVGSINVTFGIEEIEKRDDMFSDMYGRVPVDCWSIPLSTNYDDGLGTSGVDLTPGVITPPEIPDP